MKKIAVFDIDGTLFRSGLYREVVFELIRQKLIPPETRQDFSDEELNWRMRKGDEAFTQYSDKIVEAMQKRITHIKVADYKQASQKVIQKMGDYCYSFTRNLAKKLAKNGYYLIVISGSPQEVTELFAKRLNFDLAIGCEYKHDQNGYYTGEIVEPTWLGKDVILKKSLDWTKFTMSDSYAIGDTIGDASLLASVSNPIAFNPEKDLFKLATKNNWDVVIERKNMIYKLSPSEDGYRVRR